MAETWDDEYITREEADALGLIACGECFKWFEPKELEGSHHLCEICRASYCQECGQDLMDCAMDPCSYRRQVQADERIDRDYERNLARSMGAR